jgi:hypothetical protein
MPSGCWKRGKLETTSCHGVSPQICIETFIERVYFDALVGSPLCAGERRPDRTRARVRVPAYVRAAVRFACVASV